ncbi:MAG: copper amine oxidase N-terminal domain-containing protein [Clostridia bacterium]|nr:copper amine oxidase N-terminal domain-containing protein [Clostridia bacterium]
MKRFLLPIVVLALALSLCFSVAALDTVYVSDSGTGDGSTAETATNDLYAAISAVANGGTVVITDTYTLTEPFTEPIHDAVVTITGGNFVFNNAKTSRYFLNGPTTFEKVSFSIGSANTAKSGMILARFFPIVMGEGISSSGFTFYIVGGYQDPTSEAEKNLDSSITVNSGTYTTLVGFSRGSGTTTFRGTSNITVNGGTVKNVYGASLNGSYSGSANITINGGTVTSVYTGGDSTRRLNGNATVTVNGGSVTNLNINNVMGHTDVNYLGGNIGSMSKSVAEAITHEVTDGTASLVVRKGLAAHEFIDIFDSATYEDGSNISSAADAAVAVFTVLDKVPKETNVTAAKVYVSNAGSGDGLTAETALSDLKTAFQMLEGIDGTIVLVNDYPLDEGSFYEPEHDNTIVITSYDGERYFDGGLYFCGAKLNRYYLSGNTIIENTEISLTSAPLFICRWHDITFGTGMEMPANKLYVVGGYQFGTTDPVELEANGSITVKSGSYYCLIGYSRGTVTPAYEFKGTQTLNILGDASVARIYGGVAQANSGDAVVINIDGGTVADFIQVGGDQSNHSNTATVNMKSGYVKQIDMRNLLVSATVNWTGGEIESFACDNCIYNGVRNEEAYAAANEYKDTTYTLNYSGVTPTAEMLTFFTAVNESAATSTEVKMTIGQNVGYINGEAKTLDAAPIIRDSRTMLPVRFVAEAFGAEIGWDGATSTATVKTADVTIEITIGSTTAKVNGETVTLDAPAFIENSRTYMPVRFVAENLGATVAWDGATSTATLTK